LFISFAVGVARGVNWVVPSMFRQKKDAFSDHIVTGGTSSELPQVSHVRSLRGDLEVNCGRLSDFSDLSDETIAWCG
jgi:hypothetical protein